MGLYRSTCTTEITGPLFVVHLLLRVLCPDETGLNLFQGKGVLILAATAMVAATAATAIAAADNTDWRSRMRLECRTQIGSPLPMCP